jgi:hypothetical protein
MPSCLTPIMAVTIDDVETFRGAPVRVTEMPEHRFSYRGDQRGTLFFLEWGLKDG